jgi:hypothetical protein
MSGGGGDHGIHSTKLLTMTIDQKQTKRGRREEGR